MKLSRFALAFLSAMNLSLFQPLAAHAQADASVQTAGETQVNQLMQQLSTKYRFADSVSPITDTKAIAKIRNGQTVYLYSGNLTLMIRLLNPEREEVVTRLLVTQESPSRGGEEKKQTVLTIDPNQSPQAVISYLMDSLQQFDLPASEREAEGMDQNDESKWVRVHCTKGKDPFTGGEVKGASVGLGPKNIGVPVVLLLPLVYLLISAPGSKFSKKAQLGFGIAMVAVLGGLAAYSHFAGEKRGCYE